MPLSFQSSSPVTPLLADAVPSGYRCLAAPAGMWDRQGSEVLARTACRWLPVADPGGGPLYLDVAVTRFARRTDALRALTAPADVPAGMTTRPLFPPRIGEETAALRAEATAEGVRYVLYHVRAQRGCCVATLAALWRWPAGSPRWLYERLQRLMAQISSEA